MFWRVAKAVLILPGTAWVYIPLAIHYVTGGWPFGPAMGGPVLWVFALILGIPAMALAVWTVRLFVTVGDGTPGPWDPPRNFVVSGPYRYMRNPMLTAAITVVFAEALALGSWALAGWGAVFFAVNTFYFAYSEEPGLERRFGDAYRAYKAAVPRWIPRIRPYSAP